MKKAIALLTVLAALGLLRWGFPGGKAADAGRGGARGRGPGTVAVEVEPVRTSTVREVHAFSGTLQADAAFALASKVAGRLERLSVDIGDSVRNGQLVGVLDDSEHQLALEEARAELAMARASVKEKGSGLDVAEKERERARSLHTRKMLSQADLDVAESRYKAALAQHEVAQAQAAQKEAAVRAAEVRLSYTQLAATWQDEPNSTRLVAERRVHPGALLGAGDPVLTIVDLDPLVAVIHLIEQDYPRARVGQPAEIVTDAFPRQVFTGRVARIAPMLEEQSRQGRVEIEVPNPEGRLKPGMFARVHIELGRSEGATVVPRSAVVRREGRDGVFLVEPDGSKARFVPVVLGLSDAEQAEVLEPPLDGRVVTLGHHLLVDGSAIVLPEAAPAPAAAPDVVRRTAATGTAR